MKTFLPVECGALGERLKKSLTDHIPAGTKIFTARRLGKGDLIGYYHESFVYRM